jgi:short-subunit dehydrogenase
MSQKGSVFITGGSSGLGWSLAQKFQAEGYRVGLCARDKQKFLQSACGIEDKFTFYTVDVSEREALKQALKDFAGATGVDIVIANAGIAYPVKSKIPDFDRTYRMIEVNLVGVVHTFEAALEMMISRKAGHLVAISSLAGYNGFPGTSGYSATKAAVIKFCETLAIDLKPMGISVSSFQPGFIQTPLTAKNKHPMPFMLSAEKASEIIYKGIKRKVPSYAFPFFFACVVKFLAIIPRRLYFWIFSFKLFDLTQKRKLP